MEKAIRYRGASGCGTTKRTYSTEQEAIAAMTRWLKRNVKARPLPWAWAIKAE